MKNGYNRQQDLNMENALTFIHASYRAGTVGFHIKTVYGRIAIELTTGSWSYPTATTCPWDVAVKRSGRSNFVANNAEADSDWYISIQFPNKLRKLGYTERRMVEVYTIAKALAELEMKSLKFYPNNSTVTPIADRHAYDIMCAVDNVSSRRLLGTMYMAVNGPISKMPYEVQALVKADINERARLLEKGHSIRDEMFCEVEDRDKKNQK